MEKEKIKKNSENELEFRGERYKKSKRLLTCNECDLFQHCGNIQWTKKPNGDYVVNCKKSVWKKVKQFKQIIKVFRNETDFNFDRPLNLAMPVNENEENSENFTKHVLCGVVWGLTARFSNPVAAVYSVDENGNEKFIRSMHAYRCVKSSD